MKNGVPICLAKEICTGSLKQDIDDKHLCVEDCPKWFIDNLGEQRCVSECPEGSRIW